VILLAWSPYNLLDAGFQLSFAAVVAIFLVVPRAHEFLLGYPLPPGLREVLAVSLACGVATAPILWLQFGRIPLYSVPANALAAPVVAPLLALSFAAALAAPVAPGFAALIATVNGWCAAYLAGCARLVSGLPGATVSTTPAALGVLLLSTAALAKLCLSRQSA
jgi:competence protein ComEC